MQSEFPACVLWSRLSPLAAMHSGRAGRAQDEASGKEGRAQERKQERD